MFVFLGTAAVVYGDIILYIIIFQCVNNRPHCVRLYIYVYSWTIGVPTWWEIGIKLYTCFSNISNNISKIYFPSTWYGAIYKYHYTYLYVIRKTCANTPFTESCRNDIIISTWITRSRCTTRVFFTFGLWSFAFYCNF